MHICIAPKALWCLYYIHMCFFSCGSSHSANSVAWSPTDFLVSGQISHSWISIFGKLTCCANSEISRKMKPPLACYAVVWLLIVRLSGSPPHPRTFFEWRCHAISFLDYTKTSGWTCQDSNSKGSMVDIRIHWLFQESQEQWLWFTGIWMFKLFFLFWYSIL